MTALAYKVTKHTIPAWMPIHTEHPRGLAYETDTHFVHLFGRNQGLWVVSIGLTATQEKTGTLRDWVERTFGAEDVVELEQPPGHTVKGVWRPGLFKDDEMLQGLDNLPSDLSLAEQALLLLVQRMDELLHFVEPSSGSLLNYGHKSRELLILACTEVENFWSEFLKISGSVSPARGFTTNDYVALLKPLRLEEYEVLLPRYSIVPVMSPFDGWLSAQPTKSLPWYNAYNRTKHDRTGHFHDATLMNCMLAVAANLILFTIRFGPFRLLNGAGTLPAYVNQLFSLRLQNSFPQSFYVPKLKIPADQRKDLVCFNAENLRQPWIVNPLVL